MFWRLAAAEAGPKVTSLEPGWPSADRARRTSVVRDLRPCRRGLPSQRNGSVQGRYPV